MSLNRAIFTRATGKIFDNSKRTVTLYRATRGETNITGTETLSYAAGVSVEVMFFKTTETHTWDREGLFEGSDCAVFDKAGNLSLSKDDKIAADGETYILQNPMTWRSAGTAIFDACPGVKI